MLRFVPIACYLFVATTASALAQSSGKWTVMGVVVGADGKPAAGAVVRPASTSPFQASDQFPVEANARGIFRFDMPAGSRFVPILIVTSADKKHLGWNEMFMYEQNELLEIRLGQPRQARVKVVDAEGRPVDGAKVAAIHGEAHPLAEIETDKDGVAQLRLPPDLGVTFVYARAAGKGFNYIENFDSWPIAGMNDGKTLADEFTISLDGAKTVEIRLVDTSADPVPGMDIGPWTIRLPNRLTSLNGLVQASQRTDDDGIARFDWIPESFEGSISFPAYGDDYHMREYPRVASGNRSAEGTVYKLGKVTGTVIKPDGSPAANIMIQGEGRGTGRYYRRSTMTDANGRYELRPHHDQTLTIAVVDDSWAAKSVSGIRLDEGEVKENFDFQLIRGTLITGTVTVGSDDEPATDGNATLIQDPNGGNLVRWSYLNAAGRYRFRVGPGEYELILPLGAGKELIKVTDQATLTFDASAARPSRTKLSGTVRDRGGKPVAGAMILGESINAPGHAGFNAVSGSDGTFETERWSDEMLLLARDAKSNRACVVKVGPDDKQVELQLAQASRATGKLVDKTGKPHSETSLFVSLQVTLNEETARFGFRPVVGSGGSIEMSGLPRGSRGIISAVNEERHAFGTANFDVSDRDVTDLGDIMIELQTMKVPE